MKYTNRLIGFLITLMPSIAGAQTASLSANQTFTGDNFFASGRPWADVRGFGAVGDGITDDTAAVQAAINYVSTNYVGGIVFFPSSNNVYCLKSGVNIPSNIAIDMVGVSEAASSIGACGVDTTVVTMDGNYSSLRNMIIIGKGTNNDTGTFGASYPTVKITPSCTGCKLENIQVFGGSNAVSLASNDTVLYNVNASLAYGSALIYNYNPSNVENVTSGNWFIRDKFDQLWPTEQLPPGQTFSAWSASTNYSANTVVSLNGYLIQCTQSGTSGSSSPTLKNYYVPITDGTAKWGLLAPQTYWAVQLDSGSYENAFIQIDTSGPFTAGFGLTDTLNNGKIPQHTKIKDSVIGQTTQSAIYGKYGADLVADGLEIGACVTVGCSAVYLSPTWTDSARITNSIMWGMPYGILVGGGTNLAVTGNQIYGTTISAIDVAAGVSKFTITGNSLGASSKYGANNIPFRINTGASDHYNIIGNLISGATSGAVDNGTGTNKTVSSNN